MRKSLLIAAVALAAGAVSMGLGAAPTLAATNSTTTWTVSPGGHFTGTSGEVTISDDTTSAQFGCGTSQFAGRLKSGTGLTGYDIGTIKSLEICDTPSQAVDWHLSFTAYHSSSSEGTTRVIIKGIHFAVSDGGCTFVVDGTSDSADNGTLSAQYTNQWRNLNIYGTVDNLHVYDVAGACPSEFDSGDALTITAHWWLHPTLKVTSP
jgi:hypothetical protein